MKILAEKKVHRNFPTIYKLIGFNFMEMKYKLYRFKTLSCNGSA